MLPGHGREGPEQVAGFEDLLEGADRLDAFQGKPLPVPGEQAEPALVLAIKVYAFVRPLLLVDDPRTGFLEVFLKAPTASGSFLTWDFLATFIFAPNLRTTKPWKVL